MKVLFLTLVAVNSIEDRGIYQDLLRRFRNEGHGVTIVTPIERRAKVETNIKQSEGVTLLQVKTFNIQKTNLVEKGIGTLAIEYQYLKAIKKHLKTMHFDLVLYSTPPITFAKVIDYVKQRDNAYSYLLLKDIFPQNAVDMKMIKKGGFLHQLFLKKEKRLYQLSDTIGCMSEANREYIIKHNSELDSNKVEVNPNSIDPIRIDNTSEEKIAIRLKYNLPIDKRILVYGGNLGKPQGLDFLLQTIEKCLFTNVYFLIVGNGTEYKKIEEWFDHHKPQNASLLKSLPKADYDALVGACDVGLIYLHPDFSIPNFPSRLLSYLEMRKPIIAATDMSSDIGDVLEKANCGYKVLSGDINGMIQVIDKLINNSDLEIIGANSWNLLQKEYLVGKSYTLIKEKINT